MMFSDRIEAGQKLAEALEGLKGTPDLIVLGIPRGGVILAVQIAQELGAAIDIWVSKKIGAPGNSEFAIGSVDIRGNAVLDTRVAAGLGVTDEYVQQEVERLRAEMRQHAAEYRGGRPALELCGRTVILTDDGLATGSTAISACRSIREERPKTLILAVPVAPPDTAGRLAAEVDRLVVLETPAGFHAVGQFYADFSQVTDKEVIAALHAA